MKIRILVSTLILTVQIIYSQNEISGKIIYKVSNNLTLFESSTLKVSENQKKKILSAVKKSNELEYILLFNKNESIFFKKKQLKNEGENEFNFAEVLAGKGIYYFNNKERLLQKETLGETFLIKNPLINWKLTKETKKIGNYICYKAISSIKSEGRRGVSYKSVIAWYTIDIPVNFGPKRYDSLPGLILELSEGNLTFFAISINLNPKENIIVEKPLSGRKVSLEEFNEIAKNMVLNRRKN